MVEIHNMAVALYKRQYLHRYSGMGLSVFWLIFMPVLPLILYNALDLLGVFSKGNDEFPRALQLSLGITVYYLFSETISHVSGALDQNQSYIHRTGIKAEACYLSAVYEVLSNFAIRYVLCSLFIVFLGFKITVGFLYFGLLAFVVVAASFGVGVVLSIFIVFYRDTINIVQTALFYLLFASGVFGRITEDSGLFTYLTKLPTYISVTNLRSLALGKPIEAWGPFALCGIIGIVFSILSIFAYKNAKSTVISFLR
jgi:ABC-type polysaccharide/polyol phosphate export permease